MQTEGTKSALGGSQAEQGEIILSQTLVQARDTALASQTCVRKRHKAGEPGRGRGSVLPSLWTARLVPTPPRPLPFCQRSQHFLS